MQEKEKIAYNTSSAIIIEKALKNKDYFICSPLQYKRLTKSRLNFT
jgi:hypothetical protein